MNLELLLCGKTGKEMNVMHFILVRNFVVKLEVKCIDIFMC